MKCPCGSVNQYENCCGPIINDSVQAETAEQLMRSRYTAYTKGEMSYLKNTLAPESQHDFDIDAAKKWAQESEWMGLKIISTTKGSKTDAKGVVEFTATYKEKGKVYNHHEVSQFRKNNQGRWLFVKGESHTHIDDKGEGESSVHTVIRESPKIGRNEPCTCGSGKKYKKCCGM